VISLAAQTAHVSSGEVRASVAKNAQRAAMGLSKASAWSAAWYQRA
jgi:hypothetical protein